MERYFHIYLDGINDYDEWLDYLVSDDTVSEKEMFEDVRQGLREIGGGHAEIFTADDGELYGEIEIQIM